MMELKEYVYPTESGKAYIFSGDACPIHVRLECNWGDLSIELISLDLDEVKQCYKEIIDDFSAFYESATDGSRFADEAKKVISRFEKINTKYPCLFIHTHILTTVLFNMVYGGFASSRHVHPFLLCTESYRRFSTKAFNSTLWSMSKSEVQIDGRQSHSYLNNALDSIMFDIFLVQRMVKAKIEHMHYLDMNLNTQLSPIQRLAYYEYSTGAYSADQVRISDHDFSKSIQKNIFSVKKLREFSENLQEELNQIEVPLIEVFTLHGTLDIFALELYMLIINDNIVEECAYCNRFFIPRSKHKIKYCNRVAPGESLPCDVIGAKRNYESKQLSNPIYSAYDRAYKRNYARMRNRTLTREAFTLWAKQARDMREKCFKNEISLDDYDKWLGNNQIGRY